MQIAFVLGAGLGTRLRPLTDDLPKPLVPVAGRPLITYAFDHLASIGVDGFVVNTHHCPERYRDAFPDGTYGGRPITFIHEPVLLETGGGIANALPLFPRGRDLIVYNGDILTNLPLQAAWSHHRQSGDLATLVLRTDHPDHRVSFDPASNRVLDIRGELGTGAPRRHGFAGIYFLRPTFLELLPPPAVFSVIPVFLDLIRSGQPLGGVCADGGSWADLGDRDSYLDAHAAMSSDPVVDPTATVHPTAQLTGSTWIGAGATIGEGARVSDSVVWPAGRVEADADLHRCIVRGGRSALGHVQNIDV